MSSVFTQGERRQLAAFSALSASGGPRRVSNFEERMLAVNMEIKPNAGVNVQNTDDRMIPALEIVAAARKRWGYDSQVSEGHREVYPQGHKKAGELDTGFHPMNLANDYTIRGWDPAHVGQTIKELKDAGFDVPPARHGTGPHIHVELDIPATKRQLNRRRSAIRAHNSLGAYPTAQKEFLRRFRRDQPSVLVKDFQKLIGTSADGAWGANSEAALQRFGEAYGGGRIRSGLSGSLDVGMQ